MVDRKVEDEINFIVKPSDAVGVYTDHLDHRFNDMEENFREKLLDAMQWEDSVLRKHVEKSQLDKWAQASRDAARNTVNHQVDLLTAAGAPETRPLENGNGKTNGVSLFANGST